MIVEPSIIANSIIRNSEFSWIATETGPGLPLIDDWTHMCVVTTCRYFTCYYSDSVRFFLINKTPGNLLISDI